VLLCGLRLWTCSGYHTQSRSLSVRNRTLLRGPGVRPLTELTAGGIIYCTIEDYCNLSVGRNEPKLNLLSADTSDSCPNRRRNQQLSVRSARGGPRNNDGEVHIQRADAHRKVGFMSEAFYGAPELRHGYITILVDNMRCGAAGDP
jgi:hypothetical protein